MSLKRLFFCPVHHASSPPTRLMPFIDCPEPATLKESLTNMPDVCPAAFRAKDIAYLLSAAIKRRFHRQGQKITKAAQTT